MANTALGVVSTSINIGMQLANLINSFKCRPVIGGTYLPASTTASQLSQLLASDLTGIYSAGGVLIEPTEYRIEYQAEVSEQLLVNVQAGTGQIGKVFLTDNIAAHPRQWRISGYIPGALSSEIIAYAATIAGTISPLGATLLNGSLGGAIESISTFMPSLVMKQKYLESLFYGNTTFQFKTRDGEVIQNAVMPELMIERKAESQNKLNVSVVIKEINILFASSVANLASSAMMAASSAGNPADSTNLGSGANVNSVPSPIQLMKQYGVGHVSQ